jgi:hypothetical protein
MKYISVKKKSQNWFLAKGTMNRLHEGLDYLLYRIYIWGGIAALVVYFALVIYFFGVLEFIDVSDMAMLAIVSAPVTLWVLGILAYWWWVFLFKGNKELKDSIHKRPESTPEISALKSWSTLHTAMAIYGGNVDEILEAEKAARRPVIIWYGMQNLFVLWILGNFWVWALFQDGLPANYIARVWVPGVFVIMILFLVATPFLVGRARKGGEAAYLAPLGLSLAESPSDMPYLPAILGRDQAVIHEGATVLNGSRRGRLVHIETSGKHCYTWVQVEMPPFEIHSQAGKLVADRDAPEAVTRALKGLRKAKRWRGIKVTGGSDGIGIERESSGQNMWLYDLWLIERLLEETIEKTA